MAPIHHSKSTLSIWTTILVFTIVTTNLPQRYLVTAVNVTYNHRALLFDGKPRILRSGSIHYPRSTPEMWPSLIAKAKEGGLDVIQTYVFWNGHEPQRGIYNFEGRFDLVKFVKTVQKAGLFVNLRIGPFVAAEWTFGGLPVWLHLEPGVRFRTDNVPFKAAMQKFVAKIVQMMKDEQLFAWQGGPIILAQIENEYGVYADGTPEKAYEMWAAEMAVGLNTGVPWIMCVQPDAPDPVIDTFNGFYGDDFRPTHFYKPKMWTEDWSGWYQNFGAPTPYRPVKDLAFAVARFYQKNGSFHNYYMYHGGTNFGRTTGGKFIATSYDYDAPIDEYGLPNQPKWGHLKDLHEAINLCEPALLTGDASNYTSFGLNQEVFIFSNNTKSCAAFLSNIDQANDATIEFNGKLYDLPAWSVSILPDCKNVVFNSAKVNSQTALMSWRPSSSITSNNTATLWEWYKEPTGILGEKTLKAHGFLEQINVTRDTTDYLWYITSVQISKDEPFLRDGNRPNITIDSIRDAAHIFINGKLVVSASGDPDNSYFEVEQPIDLHAGLNQIAILSMTVGMVNYGDNYEMEGAGILGSVTLQGLKNGTMDLSSQVWIHQVGLKGENLSIYTETGSENVIWSSDKVPPQNQSMIWYKKKFDAPRGEDPVAVDFVSMGKGQAWVNGKSIGRFWPAFLATPNNVCNLDCDYRGTFSQNKCLRNCGQPSQRWYHIPRSWIKPTDNLFVIIEELGGDPKGISIVTRSVNKVCGYVSEGYPPPLDKWAFSGDFLPELRLQCGQGQKISSIPFASFGTPEGTCGNFQGGGCHALESLNLTAMACLGKNACSMKVSISHFGDPCPNIQKSLAVEAKCS